MTITRMLEIGPYPKFKLDELPLGEREEADSVNFNLNSLHRWATNFWCAKALFENCTNQRVLDANNGRIYEKWQLCAARDCVIAVYHFGKTIEGIDTSMGKCPTLRILTNSVLRSDTRRAFEKLFPSFIYLRHAISHSAERSHTMKASKKHGAVKTKTIQISPNFAVNLGSEDSILLLHDNIFGTTFSSMWMGEIVRLELTSRTGEILDEIIEKLRRAFEPIINHEPEPLPTVTVSRHSSLQP